MRTSGNGRLRNLTFRIKRTNRGNYRIKTLPRQIREHVGNKPLIQRVQLIIIQRVVLGGIEHIKLILNRFHNGQLKLDRKHYRDIAQCSAFKAAAILDNIFKDVTTFDHDAVEIRFNLGQGNGSTQISIQEIHQNIEQFQVERRRR